MIGFLEARETVLKAASPLPATKVPAGQALGAFLAEPLIAQCDNPPFASSAVDGYGVAVDDVAEASADEPANLRLAGEVRAGDDATNLILHAGTALRILTGAQIPSGVEAVVMKEECDIMGGVVRLRTAPSKGENVRPKGEEYRAGDQLLAAGTRLTPPICGLLASCGFVDATVHAPPRVAIVTTGDELASAGDQLLPGQIYESNSVGLASACRALGLRDVGVSRAKDDLKSTKATISKALKDADVLITTGGVSVGEHDVVKEALAAAGVEERFWRVAIKPGMPLFFGAKGAKLVFGLPGNPVSAMVNFVLFVRPALIRLMGGPEEPLTSAKATLASDLWKKPGRTEFVRGNLRDSSAYPLAERGSHMLGGLAKADCLIVLPEESGRVLAGSDVDVLPLAWGVT